MSVILTKGTLEYTLMPPNDALHVSLVVNVVMIVVPFSLGRLKLAGLPCRL
jgi:hypothetical protein